MFSELINEIYKKSKIENANDNSIKQVHNISYQYGLKKEFFSVEKKTENLDIGEYSIFNFNDVHTNADYQIYLIKHFAKEIKDYLKNCNLENILIVGLGNRHISADSLGAKVIKNIIITGHIYEEISLKKVSAFNPSVLGLTGIESSDVIESVIAKLKPTLVIFIDSLCASHYSRLGTSFQINNASIIPGGGVNNARKKLSYSTIGVNILSIGVPLVIYANTFCDNQNHKLNHLIVTLKDIEEISSICANIISYSLNMAIHDLTISKVKDYLNKV